MPSVYPLRHYSLIENDHNTKISVNIIDPSRESTLISNVILVNGTTSDCIKCSTKVEVFAHRYPFNDVFKFKALILCRRQLV